MSINQEKVNNFKNAVISKINSLISLHNNNNSAHSDIRESIPQPNTSANNIKANGTANAGSGTAYALANHVHPKDDSKEDISNKVTSISASSTDTQYPSAKAVYDNIINVANASHLTPTLIMDSDFNENDLNDYIEPGFYYYVPQQESPNANIVTLNNAPVSKDEYFFLFVEQIAYGESSNTYHIKQTLTRDVDAGNDINNAATTFIRTRDNSSWTAWRQISFDGHTHSQYLTEHQSLSGYLQQSDIKDNITSSDVNKPLSAKQGKVLKDLIDTKLDNDSLSIDLDSKVNVSDIKDNLTSTDTNKPLSAKQGKVLKDLLDNTTNANSEASDVIDNNGENYTALLSNPEGPVSQQSINQAVNTYIGDIKSYLNSIDTILSNKENVSYKVTSWSQNSSHGNYPSEKLVKDSLDNIERQVVSSKVKLGSLPAYIVTNVDIQDKKTIYTINVDSNNIEDEFYLKVPSYEADTKHVYLKVLNGGSLQLISNDGTTIIKEGDVNGYILKVSIHNNAFFYLEEKYSEDKLTPFFSDLSNVAITGSYNDLINTPTIPTKVSDLTNDANFLTSHQDISGKLNKNPVEIVYDENINPNMIDLNDYTTAGFYYWDTPSANYGYYSIYNCPISNESKFFLFVESFETSNATYIKQTLTSIYNQTFIRVKNDNTWTNWKTLTHNDDIIDNLISIDTNKALSAKQGKVLKDYIDTTVGNIQDIING